MTPGARRWTALITAACFAASGIGAYAHLAIHPHHYCPEHGRFEADSVGDGHGDAAFAHDPTDMSHAAPGPSEPASSDDHHTCPAMAFAATPLDVAPAPVWMPTPAPLAVGSLPADAGPRQADIAAFRIAPKASPPA